MIPAVLLLLAFAAQAVAQPAARPGGGAAGDGPKSCIAAPPDCVLYNDPIHHGCGTRGGPGCRKTNGHCASWNDKVARDCRVPIRASKPMAPSE